MNLILNDEKEDELTPDMELHNLYDMTEDIAESTKLKRAELNFTRRQSEEFFMIYVVSYFL